MVLQFLYTGHTWGLAKIKHNIKKNYGIGKIIEILRPSPDR